MTQTPITDRAEADQDYGVIMRGFVPTETARALERIAEELAVILTESDSENQTYHDWYEKRCTALAKYQAMKAAAK